MWPQEVNVALAEVLRPGLHRNIGLLLVQRVGEHLRAEFIAFLRRTWQLWTVYCHAAEMNELLDLAAHPVSLGNSFQHPRCSRHVDLPHAVPVENTHAQWIKHEGEMHDSNRASFTQNVHHAAAGWFLSEINPLELDRSGKFRGWPRVDTNHMEALKQRKEPRAKTSGNPCYQQ